jgi:7,8-dihydro-6-hydroxymethylpterin-pyrophosphokinase
MKTGDMLEPTSEGSSEVTEVQLNQVAKSSMTSVSRVLETCGCGVQWQRCYMNLILIIPGVKSPDIP